MADTRAAYRYALAVIGLSEELKQFDNVSRDFEFLSGLIQQSREFFLFLKSPVVNKERKKVVITEIMKGRVSELTSQFLRLLVSKGRETIIPEIIEQYNKLRDEKMRVLKASVRSVQPLSPEQEKRLVEQLNSVTKKNARLQFVKDENIIGGFVVQYDDTVWDGSVRHQLELLRQKFVEQAS